MASKFQPWVSDSNVETDTVDVSSIQENGFQSGTKAIAKQINSILRADSLVVSAFMNSILPDDTSDYTTNLVTLTAKVTNGMKALKVDNASNADNATRWNQKSVSDVFIAYSNPTMGYTNTVKKADVSNATSTSIVGDGETGVGYYMPVITNRYQINSDYTSWTSVDDYIDSYVIHNGYYTKVTSSNKNSLGITPGTTIAYKTYASYGDNESSPTIGFSSGFMYVPSTKTLNVENINGTVTRANIATTAEASLSSNRGIATSVATNFVPKQTNRILLTRVSGTQAKAELNTTGLFSADTAYYAMIYTEENTGGITGTISYQLGTIIPGQLSDSCGITITGISSFDSLTLSCFNQEISGTNYQFTFSVQTSQDSFFNSQYTWYLLLVPAYTMVNII